MFGESVLERLGGKKHRRESEAQSKRTYNSQFTLEVTFSTRGKYASWSKAKERPQLENHLH